MAQSVPVAPNNNQARGIDQTWLILTIAFYMFFYIIPLVLLPVFFFNTKYDYMIHSQLVLGGREAQIPSGEVLRQTMGSSFGGILGYFYEKLRENTFWITDLGPMG